MNVFQWTSQNATIIWRTTGLLLLFFLWLMSDSREVGVILLLFLAIMSGARARFRLPGWTSIIDQAACFIAMLYWEPAAFFLAIPLFEAFLSRKIMYSIPIMIFPFVYSELLSLTLIVVYIQSALSGAMISGWRKEATIYLQEADRQRKDRYELESLKEELLFANVEGARMAELSERNRIARQLHDDVGHELTASVLALQAFEQLWKEGDPQAKEMFTQVQQRMTKSAEYLRETVHNLKPVQEFGVEGIEEITRHFSICPVALHVYGDTSKVPPYLWNILYPCLKEALTNIVRHAEPTKVDVTLDVSTHIVRLSVYNDGVVEQKKDVGVGLRNLRQRAKAVGGSIAIDGDEEGFRFICVLPLENNDKRRS
ncbi:sensor histidine kinase [Evansella cellulosilytica]|uniref:histidine kinase n=1 Tax=Evansella cellulosilytica (strain ATCC 21833 / DSM 2522 / FERM P-1141 / JCM 9156 / N-4) TaxID=649639 RepID=E6TSQ4_EVAC2|nr:sensor histidine kinase [Evansella cellulosilytica]ADU29562.1 integral membrane sensor signal transduction histidine kinase [Evansella cellulosilytica DSM 2522]